MLHLDSRSLKPWDSEQIRNILGQMVPYNIG